MSQFGLKFSQMILHTETSKLMYNWSFLFEVLHKPTLLPSTFNTYDSSNLWKRFYSFQDVNIKRNTCKLQSYEIIENANSF